MRLSDVIYWLLDMPPDGWRVLGRVARIYRDGGPVAGIVGRSVDRAAIGDTGERFIL